jgi:phage terminase small subunit
MSLTEKQRLFVRAYLIDGNGKKAAIAAGYSPKGAEVQASRMLSHVKVQQALAEARKALAATAGVTPEWVMAQLLELASGDIRQAVQWASEVTEVAEDPNTGVPILQVVNQVRLTDSDKLTAAAAAGITEVSQTKGGLKIKRVDRLAVILAIARMLGMGQAARLPAKPAQPQAPGAKPPAPAEASDDDGNWGQLLN